MPRIPWAMLATTLLLTQWPTGAQPVSLSYPEYIAWADWPFATPQTPDCPALYLAVRVEGSDAEPLGGFFPDHLVGPLSGGDGGACDIRTGVPVYCGDGSDGDCGTSRTLANPEYHFRQVAPTGGEELVLRIVGQVVIRCQMLFAPSRIVGVYRDGQPPSLTVCAGPPVLRSTGRGNVPSVFRFDSSQFVNTWDSEAKPYIHGVSSMSKEPTLVVLTAAEVRGEGGLVVHSRESGKNGAGLPGGAFAFYTTHQGGVTAVVTAEGGDGEFGGDGGNGGSVQVSASRRSLGLGVTGMGGDGGQGLEHSLAGAADRPGGRAGRGALVAVTAGRVTQLGVAVDGGRGGDAGVGELPGGAGGNGGFLSLDATTLDSEAVVASGGVGGRGGEGLSGEPGHHGNDGGPGGVGGNVGGVSRTNPGGAPWTYPSGVPGRGGGGGDGGEGGVGYDFETGKPVAGGAGGYGGKGGDGGNGYAGTRSSVSGAMPGAGGAPGRGGLGEPKGADGLAGPVGRMGSQPSVTASSFLPPPEVQTAEWTVMLYLDASEPHLSESSGAILGQLRALEELNLVAARVNVLVFLNRSAPKAAPIEIGRLEEFLRDAGVSVLFVAMDALVPSDSQWGSWSGARVGWLTRHGAATGKGRFHSTLMPFANQGVAVDPLTEATLSSYLDWGVAVAPARKYALVYVGHGGPYGMSTRTTRLDSKGLGRALDSFRARTGRKLDLFVAYGCNMGAAEVAADLIDRVGLYAASMGRHYMLLDFGLTEAMTWLSRNGAATPLQFARSIREGSELHWPSYVPGVGSEIANYIAHPMSVVSMDGMPELLSALRELSTAILGEFGRESPGFRALQRALRETSESLPFYDLSVFLERVRIAADAEGLDQVAIAAIRARQALSRMDPIDNSPNSLLAAYLPWDIAEWLQLEESKTTFSQATGWVRMLGSLLLEHRIEAADLPATTASAKSVEIPREGLSTALALATPGDVDVISFEAAAGQAFLATATLVEGGNPGVRMSLLNARGESVSATSGSLRATLPPAILPQAGSYFLVISGNSGPGLTGASGETRVVLSLALGDVEQMRPRLSWPTGGIPFGLVNGLEPNSRRISVTNTGLGRVVLTNVFLASGRKLTSSIPAGAIFEIVPGASEVWEIAIPPGSQGSLEDLLVLVVDDGTEFRIPVTGAAELRPKFLSVTLSPPDGVQATFLGSVGTTYQVESSTDLVRWEVFGDVIAREPVTTYTAPFDAEEASARFFRFGPR